MIPSVGPFDNEFKALKQQVTTDKGDFYQKLELTDFCLQASIIECHHQHITLLPMHMRKEKIGLGRIGE